MMLNNTHLCTLPVLGRDGSYWLCSVLYSQRPEESSGNYTDTPYGYVNPALSVEFDAFPQVRNVPTFRTNLLRLCDISGESTWYLTVAVRDTPNFLMAVLEGSSCWLTSSVHRLQRKCTIGPLVLSGLHCSLNSLTWWCLWGLVRRVASTYPGALPT